MAKTTFSRHATDIEIINYDAYNIVGDQLNWLKFEAPASAMGAETKRHNEDTASSVQ